MPSELPPLTMVDLAFGGKGVARHDGMVIFIPMTIPGETVRVTLTRRKKSFAEGRLSEVLTPSPDRVKPPCPYFGRCGGCSYQHISYPAQLRFKSAQVEAALRRIGKFAEVPMRPIIPSASAYGYRSRIRVHRKEGLTGFYAANGHDLVDIEQCLIAAPEVNEALRRLRMQRRLPDGDHVASAQPLRFFEQTNPGVARELLELVAREMTFGGRLIDAYCGAGFFSRHFRDRFEEVIGIEENPFAIAHAQSLALPHETYFAGDVAEHLPGCFPSGAPGGAHETTVLLDPPAAGLSPGVVEALLSVRPREMIYVSCNPATLARDLAALATGPFRLTGVTPLDMFPQTAEIEVLARLVAV